MIGIMDKECIEIVNDMKRHADNTFKEILENHAKIAVMFLELTDMITGNNEAEIYKKKYDEIMSRLFL